MNCPKCQNEMKFFPPGVSRTKFDDEGNPKPVNASHRCQTEGCGFIHWLNPGKPGNGQARPQPQQATQTQPQRQPPPNGNRDRSIQVQCAIKCACIRFSGMDVSDETVLMFASILDSTITRGSRGPSMPSLAPVPRKPESPESYAQPDPPEWTASHPDEPPPDDNDPWAQDWQNRSRA